jgi:signal transduction histidine kinase
MRQLQVALTLGFRSLADALPGATPTRERLRELQGLVDRMGEEIHRLIRDLRPLPLEDLGLSAALSHTLARWSEHTGVPVEFRDDGRDEPPLPSYVETALYRIVQEGLTNVARHAAARRVSLILTRRADTLSLILEDDGHGFDVEAALRAPSEAGGLGLVGMQERAALVGGTVTIESSPGRGTSLFVRVPTPPLTAR